MSLGGSEGCSTPWLVDKLSGLGVCHVECGAQFSVALTCNGHVMIISLFNVQDLKSKLCLSYVRRSFFVLSIIVIHKNRFTRGAKAITIDWVTAQINTYGGQL